MEKLRVIRSYMNNFHIQVRTIGKHIHFAGEHFHKHRNEYLISHTAIAVLFIVLSIVGGSSHPNRATAAAGSLSVLGTNPTANAVEISTTNPQIQFAFDQVPTESTTTIDGNSDGKPDNVQVVPTGGSAIAGTVSHAFDGGMGIEVYTFTPGAALSGGTIYTVTLVGGVGGISANAGADYMTTDYAWSFTTATPDVVPPAISSGTISNNSFQSVALTTSAPFADAIYEAAPTIRLNFSEHVTSSTITNDVSPADGVPDNAYISYIDVAGTVTKVAGTWFVNDAGLYNYIIFSPTGGPASFRQNTEYTITLTTAITDTASTPNAMATNYVAKFLTTGAYGIIAPGITTKSPANLEGSVSAVLSSVIIVDFDQPIKPTSADGNIILYTSAGSVVSGTTTMDASDGSIVKFTPTGGNLLADQTYSVKLIGGSSGIKNVNNIAFTTPSGDNVYWTFHTSAAYPSDPISPSVNIASSNINSSGMSGVSVSVGSITIPFSEQNVMDVGTINTTNIYLSAPGPSTVVGTTVSYNYATKTATLGSIPTLSAGTTYTITVSSSVTDGSGNGTTPPTWTFTTAIAAPVATMTTPTNGASDVSTGTTIVLLFDQAISSPLFSPTQIALSKSSNGSNPIYLSSIVLSAGDTIATLTPGSTLDAGTQYFVVFVEISPAATPGQNSLTTGYKSFTTAGNPSTADLSAQLVGNAVTLADGGTLSVAGEGAGSELVLPSGVLMSATGWNGSIAIAYSTAVPSGFVSGKVVSIDFGGVSGNPVKLSGASLVVIPLAGFNPSTYAAEVAGSDGVTYVVSQCTTQYNDGNKALVTSYTLGNFASGAASAQQCYTYDSNNVYIATNHFSSFSAGLAEVVGPVAATPAGGGIVISHTTPVEPSVQPVVDEIMTPAPEVAPIPAPSVVEKFKDLQELVSTNWRYPLVKQMIDLGLMKGYANIKGDWVWNMNGTMTRAEAAVLIARYMGYNDKEKVKKAPFKDVSIGEWYASSVAYLKSMGIASGKTATTFNPGLGVSKAEFFKMAVNAHMKLHPEVAPDWNNIMSSGSNSFTDVDKSDWFYPYMNLAEAKKIVAIYSVNDQMLAQPNRLLHRINAAETLSRFMGLKSNNISRIDAANILSSLQDL